ALKNIKGGKIDTPDGVRSGPDPKPGNTDIKGDKYDGPGNNGGNTGPSSDRGGGENTSPSGDRGGGGKPDPTPPPRSDPPKSDTTGNPPPGGNPPPPPKGDNTKPSGNSSSGNNNRPNPPRDGAVPPPKRNTQGDPVDVATGEMILEQTDLELPELLLERVHLSSYRAGRWFGPSWASTVDQRLEVDATEVCYVGPDGVILVYPKPAAGEQVLPLEGPRSPLSRTADGGWVLADPLTGRRLWFAPLPGRGATLLPLARIEDAQGKHVEFDYDEFGAPRSASHSDGYLAEFATDSGRITELGVRDRDTGQYVRVLHYGYDERGRLTAVTDSSGRPQLFGYDDHGRITGWTDRSGFWFRYIYDGNGRCVRNVGDRGYFDSTFAYDRERRITTFTNSLGHATEFHLNEAGQTVREVDALGNATTFTWDRYDNLLSTTDPLGRTTRHTYDEHGERTGTVLPDDTTASSDTARTGTSETRTGRDLFGRVRSVPDRAGGHTQLAWSVEGKLLARTRTSGARELWRYDGEGNETGHTGELGQVRSREYGPFDLLTASVDATGARTTYGYDTELRLTTVTNPLGATWHYTYDPAGRLVEETDFDGHRTRYAYDAAGQLVWSVNAAGQAVEYGYDAAGRLSWRRADTETATFGYDEQGRLVTAASPEATVAVSRDQQGRVVEHTVNEHTLSFGYEDGTLRRRTPSGVDSVWQYAGGVPVRLDAEGRTIGFDHDEWGAETGRSLDGGALLRQERDAEGRLTGQRVTSPAGAVDDRRYDYRADGGLAAVRDADGEVRYQLDAESRVTGVSAPGHAERYQYDGAGNVVADNAGPRSYRGNLLTGTTAATYTYDEAGRLVGRRSGDQVWLFTWNALDRLTSVTTPDGGRWVYTYDPLGRRIGKRHEATGYQESYVWDGTALVERHAGGHVTTWEHHPLDDRPVVQLDRAPGAEARFASVVTDQIGGVAELRDGEGRRLWKARSTLWGATADPAATPLRFPGQYHDAESGLHYNVYRYYDPATGRYVSSDPLGLDPAPNPVAYVPNPLTSCDPLGLAPPGKCSGGGGNPNKRKHDDSDNAGSTGSNKKPKTYKPGDSVNNDFKGPEVDEYKNYDRNQKKDSDGKSYKDRSEDLGEAGANDYLKKVTGKDDLELVKVDKHNTQVLDTSKYKLEDGKPWPNSVAFGGSNVADVAYFDGKKLHVIEAKGGGSELTGGPMHGRVQKFDPDTGVMRPHADRMNNPNRMDQGSDTYLKDIAHAMENSPKVDGRNDIGKLINDGMDKGIVDYVPVGTKIDDSGKAVVSVLHPY
ncbi:RHS repeat-associated core domain-containing protein, partial [Prauserella cavernicola]